MTGTLFICLRCAGRRVNEYRSPRLCPSDLWTSEQDRGGPSVIWTVQKWAFFCREFLAKTFGMPGDFPACWPDSSRLLFVWNPGLSARNPGCSVENSEPAVWNSELLCREFRACYCSWLPVAFRKNFFLWARPSFGYCHFFRYHPCYTGG